jgi:hypothetical protein
MTINQVALANTFNEFRETFNEAANVVNSLQDGTGNSDVNFLTVSGQVSSNLIPSANVTYDLGSLDNRWNDLYLSGTTVYLGDAEVKYESGAFKVVVGSDEILSVSSSGESVSDSLTANNITVNEDLVVTGNLTVSGTETILNVETLNVQDKNILVANGAADAAAANGAGLTIDGADASIIYTSADDQFEINKNLDVGTNAIIVENSPTAANQVANKAYADSAATTAAAAQAILYAVVLG